ncbi:MAG: MBL fold metallo-hydrolase [Spirochaetes bacterium]|nr:MBL fold metallo-hydrolase [Spirochaetota bacterium]
MKILGDVFEHDRIRIAGNFIYPGYVVMCGARNAMIDCGLNILGPRYLASLRSLLGSAENLSHLFLTHSHYDHLGAACYLRRKISSLRIGGHEKIESLLVKESVRRRMADLSEIQRAFFPDVESDDVSFEPLALDLKLFGGEQISLGDLHCDVYAAAGHTADSLAYFFPEIGALFAGESIGVPEGKDASGVQVEFLSSYDDYVKTIEQLAALEPKIVCMAHAWIFTDDDARRFFEDSLRATVTYRKMIETALDETNGDVDKAVELIARREYDEKGTIFQERNAYLMNLAAQVRLIAGKKG